MKEIKRYGLTINDEKIKARFIGQGTLMLGDVTIEENVWVGYYCLFEGLNKPIVINKNTSISSYSAIYTHNAMWKILDVGEKIVGKVTIGKNVHLGHGTVIVPKESNEIVIGDHVNIHAYAVVSDSIPSWHVYKRNNECFPFRRSSSRQSVK